MSVLNLDTAAENIQLQTPFPPWSGVRYFSGDTEIAFAGDSSGRVFDIECPWGTQDMASALLEALEGQIYQPFSAVNALLDPAAEPGVDTVITGGIHAPLARVDATFDGLFTADISAPGDESLDHQYPYSSPALAAWRQAARNLANITVELNRIALEVDGEEGSGLRSLIEQTAAAIRAEVENLNQQLSSEIELLPGRITLSVTNDADGKHASISLLVDGSPYSTGRVTIDGNVVISGQLSAEALYAQLGDIAHLVVDSLSTSRRIAKFLASDPSDDMFIRIQGVEQEFVAGIASSATEQAADPFGELLFWEEDPAGEGVTIGANGYPYKNGAPVYTTVTETPWPVMVYRYTEQVKAKFSFEQESTDSGENAIYTPSLTLGAGNEQGLNIAQIIKGLSGLEISYFSNTGKEVGLRGTTDGYLDLFGVRRTAELDFSGWDSGYFSQKLEGDDSVYSYSVTFDAEGRPVGITDGNNFTTVIRW